MAIEVYGCPWNAGGGRRPPEGGGRAAHDASGVKTKETKFIYRITFIAPLYEDDMHVLQYRNAA